MHGRAPASPGEGSGGRRGRSAGERAFRFRVIRVQPRLTYDGWLWLDGYVRQDGMIAICLASERLIRQLQVVMNNFGLRAHILKKWNEEYQRYYHELELNGNDAKRFVQLFRVDEPWKAERLAKRSPQKET